MKHLCRLPGPSILALSLLAVVSVAAQKPAGDSNWPAFRGPNAAGVAEGFALPVEWDLSASRNILWRTEIPGLGNSSPIVWGDRLYVTTAVSGVGKPEWRPGLYGDIASVNDATPHRWIVYCLDKRTGKIVWERTVVTGVPKVKRHPKSTHASSTMATDGRHLLAFFGSEGLHCFDMDGKPLWSRDFGLLDSAYFEAPDAQWEFGSSPVIYQDLVIVQCDVLKGSFIAALSVNDGKDVWRTTRDDVPTWGTPAVYTGGAKPQVVVNGFKHIGGYDLATGQSVWRMKGGGDIPVPTPLVAGDLVLVTNAHGQLAPIFAIRPAATGDISLAPNATSNEFVAWSHPRDGSYMGTPIVYGDIVFNCRWNGVLNAYDLKSGKRLFQQRLGGGTSAFTASAVAGDGKIYIASEDGDVYVLKAGPAFQVLATNQLGESCLASPAISGGVIYFRTASRIVAVGTRRAGL
jgi:outer membrane protein assembly factor BamB